MEKNVEISEYILVCISPSPSNMKIIAEAVKMADAFHATLTAIYVKPTNYDALSAEDKARLRVTIRRLALMNSDNSADRSVYTNGKLEINYSAGCAFLNGEELKLTPMEYKLLCLLAKNTGKVLTHTYITQNIWGRSWDNDIASLRVFMVTLRKKLESAPGSPRYIQTHIGIGYRMLKVD